MGGAGPAAGGGVAWKSIAAMLLSDGLGLDFAGLRLLVLIL
jgi:hypothetical protein